MSKSLEFIQRMSEIAYLGLHNNYNTKPYEQDAGNYMDPFKDVDLTYHQNPTGFTPLPGQAIVPVMDRMKAVLPKKS